MVLKHEIIKVFRFNAVCRKLRALKLSICFTQTKRITTDFVNIFRGNVTRKMRVIILRSKKGSLKVLEERNNYFTIFENICKANNQAN